MLRRVTWDRKLSARRHAANARPVACFKWETFPCFFSDFRFHGATSLVEASVPVLLRREVLVYAKHLRCSPSRSWATTAVTTSLGAARHAPRGVHPGPGRPLFRIPEGSRVRGFLVRCLKFFSATFSRSVQTGLALRDPREISNQSVEIMGRVDPKPCLNEV